jgi:hypothetical protein
LLLYHIATAVELGIHYCGAETNSHHNVIKLHSYSGMLSKLASFQVLSAASMKMAVFWDVAPYSLVEFTDVSDV